MLLESELYSNVYGKFPKDEYGDYYCVLCHDDVEERIGVLIYFVNAIKDHIQTDNEMREYIHNLYTNSLDYVCIYYDIDFKKRINRLISRK